MSIFDRIIGNQSGGRRRHNVRAELLEALSKHIPEDKEAWPEAEVHIDAFYDQLKELIGQRTEENGLPLPEGEVHAPINASLRVWLVEDHMTAYACILPPLFGGRDAQAEDLAEDLRYEGVCFGVDLPRLEEMSRRKRYLHIFPAACGQPPHHGEDGAVKEFYERRGPVQLAQTEGQAVDFSQTNLIQTVRKGEIICQISPPTKGVAGRDVTGKILPARDGASVSINSGEHTTLSQDGQFLMAEIDGAVSVRDGKFCVERQRVVLGGLDGPSADLEYPGKVFIRGDLSGGVTVKARDDVVVEGEVRNAHIISGGNIRVQRGIKGGGTGSLDAKGQVQCEIIEGARIKTGGSVFADVMVNSLVNSGASVYVLGTRGLLAGGSIRARQSVVALKIGNQSGCSNDIRVGCDPELDQRLRAVVEELDQTKRTLERLSKSVSDLRAIPGALSPDKRALLERITEQRTLYAQKEAEINARLKEVRKQAQAAAANRVSCKELCPVTQVTIWDKSLSITTAETNCNIRIYAGHIILK